jgi:hypothetical protein
VAFIVICALVAVWAFTQFGGSGKETAVEVLLYLAYAMIIFALVAVLCIGLYISATTDPKGLVRIGIGLAGAAVIALVAYLLASGAPAIGYAGATPPTASELKLTDTILNMTYILGGAAIFAIVAGEVISAFRTKKA